MINEIRQEIDAKVERLARTPANPDPALAGWANRLTFLARSLQAYEGHLLSRVVPAALQAAPHLQVVAQPRLTIPQRALEAVERGEEIALEYSENDGPTRQLDLIVFHCRSGIIEFLECKRGSQPIGRDHQRSRLRDDAALQLIGRSYAREQLSQLATECRCVTLSYYGQTGLPEYKTLRAAQLDRHFGWNVRAPVEQHLSYFRARLDAEIPGLTGVAA